MILRGKWMIPKADGTGYEELMAEKLSDMVTYSNTTLANALENFEEDLTALGEKQDHSKILDKLSALNFSENKIIYSVDSDTLTTSPISTVGKKVLGSSDFENFRGIIQAPTAETFLWDETEKVVWQKVGSPTISSANAKFSKALQCSSGNYVQPKETITFGGNPFTVDAWLYYVNDSAVEQNKNVLNLGDFKVATYAFHNSSGQNPKNLRVFDSSNTILISLNDPATTDSLSLKKLHLEICYSGGTLRFFVNGALTKTLSRTVSRAARTIILGGATCSISEFRILDGVCLHTGNFTAPTAQYSLIADTVSLLHFDKSY